MNEDHKAPKYSLKHPSGTLHDATVADALAKKAPDFRISCSSAHDIAATWGRLPAEVGKTADLLEYRIIECQMGLFGYSPQKRLVKPATNIPVDLQAAIETRVYDGNIIDCSACWEVAQQLGLPRTTVANACQGLGLKVKNCQIGAF